MSDENRLNGDAIDEKNVIPPYISDVPNPSEPETSSGKSSIRSSSRRIEDPEKNEDLEAGPDRSSEASDIAIETTAQEQQRDPDIVDWDGPEDPYKAINWTTKKKWSNIAVISSITFLTPLASSMFAPGMCSPSR
jgi:hypothetical protein